MKGMKKLWQRGDISISGVDSLSYVKIIDNFKEVYWMKIAVASKGEGLKARIDDRFGRADYFVIVDLKDMAETTIENTAKNEASGAGGRAVRLLANEGVQAIVVPELGPKAVTAIKAFEMKVYKKAGFEVVEDAVKGYQEGNLEEMKTAKVEEHSGLRRA